MNVCPIFHTLGQQTKGSQHKYGKKLRWNLSFCFCNSLFFFFYLCLIISLLKTLQLNTDTMDALPQVPACTSTSVFLTVLLKSFTCYFTLQVLTVYKSSDQIMRKKSYLRGYLVSNLFWFMAFATKSCNFKNPPFLYLASQLVTSKRFFSAGSNKSHHEEQYNCKTDFQSILFTLFIFQMLTMLLDSLGCAIETKNTDCSHFKTPNWQLTEYWL